MKWYKIRCNSCCREIGVSALPISFPTYCYTCYNSGRKNPFLKPIPCDMCDSNAFFTTYGYHTDIPVYCVRCAKKGTKAMGVEGGVYLSRKISNPYRANPLDGLSNEQARNKVRYIMSHFTKGIFNDESWVPVNGIWKVFNDIGLDWSMTDSFYRHTHTGEPTSKTWEFEIRFTNKSGRTTTMYGSVIAAGAGTVEDPLSKYDLTAQVF